jgi:hypothetical protein
MVELRSIWKSVCLVGKMQAERTEILALLVLVVAVLSLPPAVLLMRYNFALTTSMPLL